MVNNMLTKKKYQVNLYKNDQVVMQLEGDYNNRHEIEEVARNHIKNGFGDSMGAIEEVTDLR